ncbi:MAG TPA: glycerol-3-phosphate dehydrogenase/oxidase [Polyangiaceae bacterium]|nr:glycerol-3-phosphate dehydrogenase/oxidase [Polyangiaceae bacterium]
MRSSWTLAERTGALERACVEKPELVIIGGGITGAGVLRDASLRGIRSLLLERGDFAGGTSSSTSKMIHGGLRYIAEGQLGVTRESCVERDLMARLNPNLVAPLPFMFCSFDDGVAPWKMIAGLSIYSAVSGFRRGSFKLLRRGEIEALSRDVRKEGLRAAGFYYDQQVDDARLVLETIKDARRAGAEAISYAEAVGFEKIDGEIRGVRVRDVLHDRPHLIGADVVVNAAGPSVDRVRDLDAALNVHELRPAKGVHVVIDRARVHAEAAVTFQAADGRHMFLCPWRDVHLIGTTDTFTDEIDEPRVTATDLQYVLDAANHAFPGAKLGATDVMSVYAGVRPLLADGQADVPPSSVSREHRITEDDSGMISAAGGKLTTYRRIAEQIVDRVVARLPEPRRRQLVPCATKERSLRDDGFDRAALRREMAGRFHLDERTADRLIATWGAAAVDMMEASPAEERVCIGRSRFLVAEVSWSFAEECAATLADVLERRVRVAVFAAGQGLDALDALAGAAARATGWNDARTAEEVERYRAIVHRRYQVKS